MKCKQLIKGLGLKKHRIKGESMAGKKTRHLAAAGKVRGNGTKKVPSVRAYASHGMMAPLKGSGLGKIKWPRHCGWQGRVITLRGNKMR